MIASPTLTTLASFTGSNGAAPVGDLLIDAAGNLYGTTTQGGAYGYGTVFEIAADTHALTTLVSFTNGNGNMPLGGLAMDAAGNLYGTTYAGGRDGVGTVFEIAADTQTFTTLISFASGYGTSYGKTIALPSGELTIDAAGNLYGTAAGGAYGYGTAFEITAGTHELIRLASFDVTTGYDFRDGLMLDAAGNLYGTARNGGAYGAGTVFEITAGTHEVITLASFNVSTGNYPKGGLVMDAAGNLYGTTTNAGSGGYGTVFEITAGSHELITLASFDGRNGAGSVGDLIIDAAGNLYGTSGGGTSGYGKVFKITAGTHELITLASFDGSNGWGPSSGLVADAAGNLYGTTKESSHNWGTVFQLSNTGFVLPAAAPQGLQLGAASDSGVQGDGITNATRPGISGTAAAGSTVTLYEGTTALGSTTADSDGHWSISPALALAEGSHSLTAIARTAQGATSAASTALGVTIDTTAPTVAITSANGQSSQASRTIAGTGEAGSTVQLYDGASRLGGAVTVDGTGHWSTEVTLSGLGDHAITARDTDAAGNTGTSAILTLTLAPVPSLGKPQVTGGGTATGDDLHALPASLFGGLTVTNGDAAAVETVRVTLSDPANGTLSPLGGGSYDAMHGVYTVTGTAAAVTAALDGLVFTPTLAQVAPGQSIATHFAVEVTDAGGTASTSVTALVTAAATAAPTAAYTSAFNLASVQVVSFQNDAAAHSYVAGSGDTTIWMGAGGGSIRLGAGEGVVHGGAGKDAITFGPGLGTVTGGAGGLNTFTFVKGQIADPTAHDGQYDTVTDFHGAGKAWTPDHDFIWLKGFGSATTLAYEHDLAGHPEQHLYRVTDGDYSAEFVLAYAGAGVQLNHAQWNLI